MYLFLSIGWRCSMCFSCVSFDLEILHSHAMDFRDFLHLGILISVEIFEVWHHHFSYKIKINIDICSSCNKWLRSYKVLCTLFLYFDTEFVYILYWPVCFVCGITVAFSWLRVDFVVHLSARSPSKYLRIFLSYTRNWRILHFTKKRVESIIWSVVNTNTWTHNTRVMHYK